MNFLHRIGIGWTTSTSGIWIVWGNVSNWDDGQKNGLVKLEIVIF